VKSISSARKQVRAQAKHRAFHRIDYKPRVSHFDPNSEYRDFRGFFVLFWISLAIMVISTVLRNIKDTGYPFRVKMWSLLIENTWQLGLSDGAMVLTSGLCLPLQKVFRKNKGFLRWAKGGIVLQSLFQAGWLAMWMK
jgi:sterol O-acyltransferase